MIDVISIVVTLVSIGLTLVTLFGRKNKRQ